MFWSYSVSEVSVGPRAMGCIRVARCQHRPGKTGKSWIVEFFSVESEVGRNGRNEWFIGVGGRGRLSQGNCALGCHQQRVAAS